jgi:penicillin-binding protein 1A
VDNKNTDKHEPQPTAPSIRQGVTSKNDTARILLYAFAAFSAVLVIALIAGSGYVYWLVRHAPDIDDLQQAKDARPSIMLSADGKQLAVFKQVQQQWVSLDHISPHVIDALIATEDRRFYEHNGVDFSRTVSAAYHTIEGNEQGGSTITQQLARNAFPEEIGRSRTITRKLKEMITAIQIEQHYSKQQILETYLNTVPFLYNVTGIEMAARTYYDKPASQLDVLESATLVGMLKGTSYYNPIINPDRAKIRRNIVLAQMVKYGVLSPQDYNALRTQSLQVHFTRQQEPQEESALHFIAFVRRWMEDWADKHDVDLDSDGLVIQTTLDMELQEAAVRAVARQSEVLQDIADVEWGQRSGHLLSTSSHAYVAQRKHIEPFRYFWAENADMLDTFIRETPEFKKMVASHKSDAEALKRLKSDADFMAHLRTAKTRLETGFTAIDPTTGEVKAWVGSRNFEQDQFDHVAQAMRQPGSTFKPIVYGAALEEGFSPYRTYQDIPVTIRSADGSLWHPTDMSGNSGQPMTLRDGLVYSKNTITAQVMQDVGLSNIIDLARAVGIKQSKLDPVPSLSLGTSPVTLLEMVSAYSTIADEGKYRPPVFVKRILDRNGKVLADFSQQQPQRALSENSAIDLIDMMRGVVTRGTGKMVKTHFNITADVAGKTGTTQNNTDGWFILMHPNLVAGAWVGFNDSRVTMRSNYWGQGGHNASLVVGDFFRNALKEKFIDVKAHFPHPRRMSLMATAKPTEDATSDSADEDDVDTAASTAQSTNIVVRRDGNRVIAGDMPGVESMAGNNRNSASRNAADVGHILSGMGRDPMTGERIESSGDGLEGVSQGATGSDTVPPGPISIRPNESRDNTPTH